MSTRELVLDTPNLESMVEAFQTMPRSPDSFVMQHRAISSSDFTSLLKPSIEDAPDPAQRVQAGIQLLDAKMPGWRDNINWDILDLGHIHNCILGQLYQDDYYYGLGALGVPNGTAWRYGFEI